MSTPAFRGRSLASRLADAIVLLLGIASVLTVAEVAVRPFYPAAPDLLPGQVRHRASPSFGWEMIPDPAAVSFTAPAPIDMRGHRDPSLGRPPVAAPVAAGTPPSRWLVAQNGPSLRLLRFLAGGRVVDALQTDDGATLIDDALAAEPADLLGGGLQVDVLAHAGLLVVPEAGAGRDEVAEEVASSAREVERFATASSTQSR